ncbi:argininosuccinate lyase [Pontibacillus yanchengensis]|uniref:Argininosuccinate lyase n=2 Tax=Pontibacillus yanchengensis TaxID=462910 RepID=A0ACC7VI42_9BACI|nr:argininosuccinate lyase [Pontibacillus yanchengensis]MYL34368.1 argininosuccinate lyase [Pontibacillus yanchengensis]MYL53836.1 argininosuccinate lyase [Pontibacillus yanchengensis]
MSKLKEAFEKEDGIGFPGKTYAEELLKPVFNDQKEHLFDSMFMIHRAHTIMLKEQAIISEEEGDEILMGVHEVCKLGKDSFHYAPEYEDLFFMVESKISNYIGDDLAGKMHIARSRNDMGEAMYRLVIRDYLLELISNVQMLGDALVNQADSYKEAVMPAHTHTQPAQPTTFGHYLLAISDNLSRDIERLWNAYHTVNKSPMGAAAITTTGFSINRERMVELLGFEGVMENSYDAIGTGDYLLESGLSLVSLMTNTGRWIQEFLRMASNEVGLLNVSDAYVQISSIMPQKRNPVSLEHSRALASSAVGEGLTAVQMIHNTPYGDIVDTEDDLQPHLYRGFNKAIRVVKLLTAVVTTMNFNKERALQQASTNMITITELADVLARDYNVPFRNAHHFSSVVSKNVKALGKELYEVEVNQVNEWLEGVQLSENDWKAIVDPRQFVNRRNICGGPNPDVVKRMLENRVHFWGDQKKKIDTRASSISNVKVQLSQA